MLLRVFTIFFLSACLFVQCKSECAFANTQDVSTPLEGAPTVKVGYIPGDLLVHRSKANALILHGAEENFSESKQNGYLYELLARLSVYTRVNYQLIPTNLHEMPRKLAQGEIDVFGPSTMHIVNDKNLQLTNENFGMTQVVLVTGNGEKIFYDDPQQMDGKSVAILRGTHFEEYLDDYIKKHRIIMNRVYYDKMHDLQKSSEKFHFVNTLYVPKRKQIASALGTLQMRFVAERHKQAVLDAFDDGLRAALTDDRFFLYNLYEKFFLESSRKRPALTWAQASWLKRHIPLVVGTLQGADDSPAINVLQKVSVGYMNFLSHEHSLAIRFSSEKPYQLKNTDGTENIEIKDNLNHSEALDVLLAMFGNKTDLESFFIPTKPYHMLSLVFLVNKNNMLDSFEGMDIGVLDYLELDTQQLKENYPHATFSTFSSLEELRNAYEKDRIDAILMTNIEEQFYLGSLNSNDVILPTTMKLPCRLYIAKRHQNYGEEIFNALIVQTDELQVARTIVNVIAHSTSDIGIKDFFRKYFIYIVVVILLISGAYSIVIMYLESKRKQQLLHVLNKDPLTGIASLYKFKEDVQKKLLKAMSAEYLLISFDIDGFGMINSVYGYEKGNDFLACMAQNLEQVFPEPSIVTRAKDDIFLIFTKNNNMNRYSRSAMFRDDILMQCAREILDVKFPLSLSRGLYIVDAPEENLDHMIDCCNMARERGKHIHGITNTMFTHEMRVQLNMRTQILLKMEQALMDKEFVVLYQPKVDLQTSLISGAEALVRWYPKGGTQIFPDAFIPLFEENGFISQLDYYVFDYVCQFIRKYKNDISVPPIAINLSGVTIMNINTCSKLIEIVNKYALSPEDIEVEITESAIVDESAQFVKEICALREAGFYLAMDDFGSGVSSLNRLRNINVDAVKLDKAFLDDNLSEKKGIAVVENIVNLIKQLDMKVVAEGVETIEHTQWLKRIHCDIAQGYFFDRPLHEEQFVERLKNNVSRQSK